MNLIQKEMRLVLKIFLSGLAALFLSSCLFLGPSVRGNGEVREEVRQVGEFSEVRVTSGMNVYIVQGDIPEVKVIADENLIEIIETKTEGGILEIRALANIWSASEKKVRVTVKDIRSIEGTAGSNIYTDGQLKLNQIALRASAGCNMRVDIDVQSADVSLSSGANIFLNGKAGELVARTSSGANLKAEEFKAEISDIKVSSGSNVWVTAMKDLTAHASSGGNVFYYGTPDKTSTTSSSGGNISKRD